jgi:hypothetical protein
MSGTWTWYLSGLEKLITGQIDFDTDSIYMMLATDAYTPNQDTHNFRDDVTPEASGTGYSAGGKTVGTVTVSTDGATNEVRIVWPDVAWTTASITARTAVIYKSRGGAASADELIAYCTESANVTSTANTFTVDIPAASALKITAS